MKSDLEICTSMRRNLLELAYNIGNLGAHIGAGLSIIEILKVIYMDIKKDNDYFILSKGHAGIGYYTILHEVGLLTKEQLLSFGKDGSILSTHPSKNLEIGIECSTGSLGMGLSYGIGKALSAKIKNNNSKTYVLLGDGECNEGCVWEGAIYAGSQKLDNLTVIVDANNMQSDGQTKDILSYNLSDMWKACGWHIVDVDGHNCKDLQIAFRTKTNKQPLLIYANTIKGKGISFMEHNNNWHHSRLTKDQYQEAISELEASEVSING
ncbi:hypothetical protein AN642_01360 [Epulopiscium sp. SCG-B10WGA-EpuloA2]|nr:hypothetical protein AN642_01360 [Epulopiscium sp. SCG-B10WGA-EpuloA2]